MFADGELGEHLLLRFGSGRAAGLISRAPHGSKRCSPQANSVRTCSAGPTQSDSGMASTGHEASVTVWIATLPKAMRDNPTRRWVPTAMTNAPTFSA